jgi:hypothetical protein
MAVTGEIKSAAAAIAGYIATFSHLEQDMAQSF